jgi:two-component system cell cycle sensor histidine kinase/response regulator CckA
MIIGATGKDVTSEDSVAFARAMGNQVVQSLELAKSVAGLSQERDRAQRYLDIAEVILIALDLGGGITLINRKGCRVLGWAEGELIGRDFIETCVPARLREQTRQKLRTVHAADDAIVESPIVTRTGKERLIEWRTAFQHDDKGRIVGTLSSGTDITERTAAEAQVRLQSAALNAAANAMVITDRAGLIEWVNPAYSTLTGYASAEAVGRNPRDLVKSDHHDRAFYTHLWETILAGQVWRAETVNRRKNGSLYTEEQTITPVQDLQGEITHFIDVKHDITERKRAEEQLRTTEERMRFALQNAGVGIWDMDCTTGDLRWSETLEAHYGVPRGTFGRTFDAFLERIHPEDRDSLLETVGKAMKSGSDFTLQNRSIWPDGTIRWLSGSGRVLLGEHGEPVRAVGISLDVTERRTLEEQYQQAQKMEAVGRLAGGVAHDFNNLLTVILGYCELLLSELTPADPHHAFVSEMQRAGERAGGLTRQLLAFSRKQIIEPTQLDLNVVTTDMRAMLGRLIGEDVSVVLVLRPNLALVTADRGQVEQIVMNLAVNARDAMPKGGTLTIETANVELDEHYAKAQRAVKPGPYVALTMTDTGTGMTPEVQARLFEPFFTTKEVGKGTGLGMATVYGIVTRSGGTVGVYSEIGKGTSFKVYFPRAEPADMALETQRPVAPAPVGTQTVLVVEDEDGLRELARKLLMRQGYTVLVAANADEALRLFEANQSIDVVLTDVIMPGASGPELTRQLVEQRPALRVIYMSGYTEDAIVRHGVLRPGIAFLNKPFNSATLGAKIREVLER